MEKHPAFMTKEIAPGDEITPLIEGIPLKCDLGDTPEREKERKQALAYKLDGNNHFKIKRYDHAVESYTIGLKAKCDDKELNAHLFCNRAAANFNLGKFQLTVDDCTEALSLLPNYMKAIKNRAQAHLKLNQYDECLKWCDKGFEIDSSESDLQNLEKETKEIIKQEEILKKPFEERGIQVMDKTNFYLSDLKPTLPGLTDCRVHLSEDGSLVWPVAFIYPEHGITDVIREFNENTCLMDHFNEIFNNQNRPTWDVEKKYIPRNLSAYYGHEKTRYIPVNSNKSLKSITSDERFKVLEGTPGFFIVVEDSAFHKDWIQHSIKTTEKNIL